MFQNFVRSKILRHLVTYITISAVTAAAFSFMVVGISADSYTQYELDTYDILRILNSSSGDFDFYNNNGTDYHCFYSSSSSISTMSYGTSAIRNQAMTIHDDTFAGQPFWFEKITGNGVFMINITLPFDYMVKGGDTFSIVCAGFPSNVTNNIQVLTSDGQLLVCSVSQSHLSNVQTVSDGYLEWYINTYSRFYKYARKNNGSLDNNGSARTFYRYAQLVEVTLPAADSYYEITNIIVDVSRYTGSESNGYITPAVQILSMPYYYEENGSGGGSDYSPQLEEILSSLDDVNNKLDELTGPASPEQQQQLDNIENQFATEAQNLEEQIDYIHEATMPPEEELPTAPVDPNDFEDIGHDISDVFDLDLLNLFNILIPCGCAGFIIFTTLRRF